LRGQERHQRRHFLGPPGAPCRHQALDGRRVEDPSAMPESMMPGATALTVIPRLASSSESDLVALFNASLAAA
jgi:hypothetical protein